MGKSKKFVSLNGRQYYSESFKKFVVRQVESGKISKEEAKYKYQIRGNSAVLNWCRQYGKNNYYKKTRLSMSKDKTAEAAYKRRIKELEKELSDAKLRVKYLECVIDVAEDEMGIEIEKKLKAPPSENVLKKPGNKQQ